MRHNPAKRYRHSLEFSGWRGWPNINKSNSQPDIPHAIRAKLSEDSTVL